MPTTVKASLWAIKEDHQLLRLYYSYKQVYMYITITVLETSKQYYGCATTNLGMVVKMHITAFVQSIVFFCGRSHFEI